MAASIWTDDLSQAHDISDKLHVGTVSVNTVDAFSTMTPFGGFKQSGTGNDYLFTLLINTRDLKQFGLNIKL